MGLQQSHQRCACKQQSHPVHGCSKAAGAPLPVSHGYSSRCRPFQKQPRDSSTAVVLGSTEDMTSVFFARQAQKKRHTFKIILWLASGRETSTQSIATSLAGSSMRGG